MTALVEITERQMREAEERARKHVAENPVALSATFLPEDGRLSIELSNGASFAIPARLIQGLENASNEELGEIEITASGTGLYFPAVDADILVLPLLAEETVRRVSAFSYSDEPENESSLAVA